MIGFVLDDARALRSLWLAARCVHPSGRVRGREISPVTRYIPRMSGC